MILEFENLSLWQKLNTFKPICIQSFTENITDDIMENISPPTFSFCPFDPVQYTAWENL